eukprot:gene3783-4042_t
MASWTPTAIQTSIHFPPSADEPASSSCPLGPLPVLGPDGEPAVNAAAVPSASGVYPGRPQPRSRSPSPQQVPGVLGSSNGDGHDLRGRSSSPAPAALGVAGAAVTSAQKRKARRYRAALVAVGAVDGVAEGGGCSRPGKEAAATDSDSSIAEPLVRGSQQATEMEAMLLEGKLDLFGQLLHRKDVGQLLLRFPVMLTMRKERISQTTEEEEEDEGLIDDSELCSDDCSMEGDDLLLDESSYPGEPSGAVHAEEDGSEGRYGLRLRRQQRQRRWHREPEGREDVRQQPHIPEKRCDLAGNAEHARA